MKKLIFCVLALSLVACSVGGNVSAGGGSNGVGMGFGIGTGFRF
ncbi:hypothetical protein F542_12240 [Bibersteinia trehalosi USDA-ARS-USMARC-188]|uniref:Lipoprotein n=4 Tax=Bibersteinia trehalosi TaxID=47735 RepID=W0RA51_BIBTR|nr:hypothetical protein [Bibersteinia trehalosi]AGH38258.1 hypothetical protein WQG_9810 [Bibersteinia trehalosi USDA-ARS-USMARC-192]AHG81942.1 hypothetical protein F542_12240 [Bibersteinia trehalosi USDA-ARS-USMARC-188]AHG84242.1 hypothetical protein F543_13780 [Bibersteinia trehalosi USDA-ARS-USMARC-189]AHG86253.1 hypothetical protein F544_10240 [Bibersteinia trehalosi USDA-ARS-USMARC-190]OAQ15224.1 hypothetical protein F480_01365 [Bibersteinia trehalosi Y31]